MVWRFTRLVCDEDMRWLVDDVVDGRRTGRIVGLTEGSEWVLWYTSRLKERELEKRSLK